MRQFDWADTALGSPDQWPQSLRTILSVMLPAKFPMMLWWGPDLIQFYNDAYRPALGNSGKHPDAMGQRGEICWPESWSDMKPLIDEVMAGGEATRNQDQLMPIYRNGQMQTVYWTHSYSPVLGETGEVAGTLVVCQETARHEVAARRERIQFVDTDHDGAAIQAYPQIAIGEAYLQHILRRAAVGIAVFRGPDLVIELANPAICILWGRTEAEVLGKSLSEAMPEVIEQGFDMLLTNVMQTGKAFVGKEVPVLLDRNNQSETVYFDFVYEPLTDIDGQVQRVLTTASDVTERVKVRQQVEDSETNLRALFEQAPVAIAILRGPELTYELANQQYLSIIGRNLTHNLIGKPLLVALPELHGQGIDTLIRQVMRSGKTFTAHEMAVDLIKNGQLEKCFFTFVYEPLRSAAQPNAARPNAAQRSADGGVLTGQISGVFIVVIEVTDSVLARGQAEQLLVRERELNDLKSNFVTLASHEFRTPMGTILSSASLIGRYNGPDEGDKRERHVQRIKSAVHSLTGLLNDFLSLSQMEQTTMHGQPRPMDISLFCHEVIEDMQGIIKPGQQVIYQHLAGEVVVSLDGQMLKNILINLLVNASKYSADEKEIELATVVQDHQLLITVKDQGIGIPDADKDKLFINFFRARNAIHVSGTGLGLYVVKRYVDLLGGTVTFTSEQDSGTTFTVQLPLSPLPPV